MGHLKFTRPIRQLLSSVILRLIGFERQIVNLNTKTNPRKTLPNDHCRYKHLMCYFQRKINFHIFKTFFSTFENVENNYFRYFYSGYINFIFFITSLILKCVSGFETLILYVCLPGLGKRPAFSGTGLRVSSRSLG